MTDNGPSRNFSLSFFLKMDKPNYILPFSSLNYIYGSANSSVRVSPNTPAELSV